MRRIIIFFFWNAIMINQILSQTQVGGQVGVRFNVNSYAGPSELLSDYNSPHVTPYGMAYIEKKWNNQWALQAGLHYHSTATHIAYSNDFDILGINIPLQVGAILKTQNIGIPVALKYRFPSTRQVGYFASAGIEYQHSFEGKIEPQLTSLFNLNIPSVMIDSKDFNSSRWAANTTVGVEYQITQGQSLFFQAVYQHAFEGLAPEFLIDTNIKNKGFSVGIGYAMSI